MNNNNKKVKDFLAKCECRNSAIKAKFITLDCDPEGNVTTVTGTVKLPEADKLQPMVWNAVNGRALTQNSGCDLVIKEKL